MPKKRTSMSKIHDVLRLKFEAHLSNRHVAACLQLSCATITDILSRFRATQLPWPLPPDLTELQLEARLFPGRHTSLSRRDPDFALVHQELKRKGMTKLLLWQEYREAAPETAYGYTQFCHHYAGWVKRQKRSMRQLHTAGEKLFIDFCGPTIPIVNPDSGECRAAQIFVATLGASNFTYVEACESQNQESWLMAHANAFEFLGGVPHLLVPDNLKSAVSKADRYEPTINANYLKLARHYNTAVMPARPYKPKDKAKAENAVLIVERWILMRLRHQVFHTLASVNVAIRELLHELNQRPFREMHGCRQSLFDELDKPALRPLPAYRYEYVEVHQAKVGPDYHVLYRRHAYSVPHVHVGERVSLEASARMVRIYLRGQLIAQHVRSQRESGFTTLAEHMPLAHQKQKWTPQRLLGWGESIGPGTRQVVEWQLNHRAHPEQAYRSCLGLLNLARHYTDSRLEAACQHALTLGQPHRQFIHNLLKHHREGGAVGAESQPEESLEFSHTNLRGAGYYH
jgi:transposase